MDDEAAEPQDEDGPLPRRRRNTHLAPQLRRGGTPAGSPFTAFEDAPDAAAHRLSSVPGELAAEFQEGTRRTGPDPDPDPDPDHVTPDEHRAC